MIGISSNHAKRRHVSISRFPHFVYQSGNLGKRVFFIDISLKVPLSKEQHVICMEAFFPSHLKILVVYFKLVSTFS